MTYTDSRVLELLKALQTELANLYPSPATEPCNMFDVDKWFNNINKTIEPVAVAATPIYLKDGDVFVCQEYIARYNCHGSEATCNYAGLNTKSGSFFTLNTSIEYGAKPERLATAEEILLLVAKETETGWVYDETGFHRI